MILTIPNLISAVRIALIPVFLWLLLGKDDPLAAGLLIGGIGATDWVDGYLARRLGQVSPLGKILDPVADRLAVVAALVAGWISGYVPVWFCAALLAREAWVVGGTVWLAMRRIPPIPVRRLGKIATFAVYFAVPSFLVHAGGAHDGFLWFAYAVGVPGLVLYWAVGFQYAGDARKALNARAVSWSQHSEGEAS
jgi:cardiolipin synthase